MKSIRTTAYILTDKGMSVLAPFQLTHDAIGIIEAARNLAPTPPQQSHVDLVNEEILGTLHQELESLNASLKIIDLDDHDFYASMLEKIKAVRQQISDLENDRW